MEALGDLVGSIGSWSVSFVLLLEFPPVAIPLILVVVALLFLSGLVSGSEVAFFSLSPGQIEACAQSKSVSEKRVVTLLSDQKRLLATILILNNLVNVGIVVISTAITTMIIGKENILLGFVIQSIVVTAAIVFLGEIVPKVLAKSNNLQFAMGASKFMDIAQKIFTPFSTPLMSLDSFIANRVKKHGYKVTKTEIDHAFEMATEHKASDQEKEILKGVISFGSKTAKQIMRSRMDIAALKKDVDFYELLDYINNWGFSRIPVYHRTLDTIEGILYIKDVIPHIHKDRDFDWHDIIRTDIFFVPENKHIDSLLREFQERRVHIAIVVDEYGGTCGLITMEDILEEIVGDITDEFDREEEVLWKQIGEDQYLFDGKTPINDFCKFFNLDSSLFDDVRGDNESLAGMLVELFSKLPMVGQKIEIYGFLFTITAVDKKRIKKTEVRQFGGG